MKLNPCVIMREEFDGNGLIFDPDQNKVMTLNASGVAVWQVLSTGGTMANAVEQLQKKFQGGTSEQITADVQKFIDTLRAKSLLSDD